MPARACLLTLITILAIALLAPGFAYAAEDAEQEKSSTPTARFVVLEDDTDAWHSLADWRQQTDIPFSLVGTLPADISEREGYAWWLVARPGEGLANVRGSARVTLSHADGTTEDVTSMLEVGESDHEVWAGSSGLLEAIPSLAATDTLTLTYSARLTDAARVGLARGNESWAHIEYEAGSSVASAAESRVGLLYALARAAAPLVVPEAAPAREPGLVSTPDMQTIVYAYRLVVRKVGESGEPLAAAKLALRDGDGLWYVDGDDWTDDASAAAVRVTGEDGAATFNMVDSEYYEVVELEAPEGYDTVGAVDVDVESSVPESATLLSAKSSRGRVAGVDSGAGVVELEIADPIDTNGGAGAASGDGAGPSGAVSGFASRMPLSRTGDAPATPWHILITSVTILLLGALVRRREGGHIRQRLAGVPGAAGATERKNHGRNNH